MNIKNFRRPPSYSEAQFKQLKEAMTYLSKKQREVLRMRFWENMSILEISNCIGLSWKLTDEYIDSAINHLRIRILKPDLAKRGTAEENAHSAILPVAA